MKKFLFLGALAAMLLGTASCSNDMEPAMGDNTVQFTIELPGAIDSRAIADGMTANKLTVAVYDEKGNELPDIRVNKDIPHQTTVTFQLVKGQKYSFAFWAQAEGAPYNFDTANKTVNVSYTDAKSNDEKRDAFYAYRADLIVTGPMTETIYLYRPFAQLNYGASDYAEAIKAGVKATKSAVTVNHAATSFNLATGETDGDQAVTFTQEILPNEIKTDGDPNPDKLTVEGTQYDWMAMNYFLVPSNEAVITTNLKLYEEGATNPVRDLTVYSVPVQKNHRTNILGNLFTDDVNFNIIIDERFDQPDLGLMSNPDEIAAAIQTPNAVVSIAPGIALDLKANTIAEGVTISANGSKISFGANEAERTLNAANVTIDNCIISNKDLDRETPAEIETTGKVYKNALIVKGANFTLSNCSFAESSEATANRLHEIHLIGADNAKFENCSFEDNGIFKAILVDGASTMTIDNCVFDATYPFNCNSSTGDVVVNNSKLYGWTSWQNGDGHTVVFNNCEFGQDTKGTSIVAVVRPYTNSTFTNCKFSADMRFSPQNNIKGVIKPNTSTFTNCTWSNGDALNEPFLSTDNDPGFNECVAILGNVTWKNLVVDGVQKWVQQ